MPTPVRCPDCRRRLRLDEDEDVELALRLHSLSGRCSCRPTPPKIKGQSPPTIRIRTLSEELGGL